jgi:acetyl esterase/lipase
LFLRLSHFCGGAVGFQLETFEEEKEKKREEKNSFFLVLLFCADFLLLFKSYVTSLSAWDVLHIWNTWLLVLVLQACYYPLTVRRVPDLRNWFRTADRIVAKIGLMGGVTGVIVFSQMFSGLFGTEAGIHGAFLNYVFYKFFLLSRLSVGNAIVDWTLFLHKVAIALLCVNYFACPVITWIHFSYVKSVKRVFQFPHSPSLVAQALAELRMLSTSLFSLFVRDWYPNVSVKRGVMYDEQKRLRLDVYYPTNFAELSAKHKLPVFFYLHGGSWVGGHRSHVPSFVPYFVARGGVAVSASYRLAPKDPFPAQIQDANAALRWVEANIAEFGGDPSFIISGGGSAGSHLTTLQSLSMLEEHNPLEKNVVRGVICCYGVFDWGLEGEETEMVRLRRFISRVITRKSPQKDPQQFAHGSPIYWVQQSKGKKDGEHIPYLLLHGSKDNIVPPDTAQRFFDRLREHDFPATLVDVFLAHHGFDFFHSLRTIVVNDFLCRWLFQQWQEQRAAAGGTNK